MNKKVWLWIGGVVLVLGALFAVLWWQQQQTQKQTNDTTAPSVTSSEKSNNTPDDSKGTVAAGRYVTYDATTIASQGYTQTILFFHAAWCPECRAFEQAIESSAIPDGVQIVKVDYDTATELRQKYGVTLQSTFVEVAADGSKKALWVGYGKDKSVEAILENL